MNLKTYSTRNGLFHGFLRYLFDIGIVLSELKFNDTRNHLHPERIPENVVNYSSDLFLTSKFSETYDQFISIE